VWIDIPLDVQAAMLEPESLPGFTPPASEPDPALPGKVARAIELLNEAERPLLLFGNGVRLAKAQAEMAELIGRAAVPVECTWSDLVPQDHPLFVGRPGSYAPRGANFALQNSDLLMCVGARLDLALVGFSYKGLARAAQKVLVDIDPAELAKVDTPVAVPICADARDVLRELLRQAGSIAPRDRSPWLARCSDWKSRYPFILPEYSEGEGLVSVYHLSDVIVDQLAPDDVIVCGSSGMAIEVFITAFRARPGQRVLHTAGLGAMGCALPSCLGAALAGGRRTVVVDGDGGFQLNIQELATLARLNLPIKYFVVNNGGYASIRAMQANRFGGHLVAADSSSGLNIPDITAVAAAYGLTTRRIERQPDVRDRVAGVLATPGTVVCEVMARHDEARQPTLAARQLPNGSMVSNPLEDLSPLLPREEFLANMIVPPVEP
jgi:acetolactate synthase-1/2/3 large subunit